MLPGIIGTFQATEAIKLLTGIGEPMIGKLLHYDALLSRFKLKYTWFGPFGAPLVAPDFFYTFYAHLLSFPFIFRAIWSYLSKLRI